MILLKIVLCVILIVVSIMLLVKLNRHVDNLFKIINEEGEQRRKELDEYFKSICNEYK